MGKETKIGLSIIFLLLIALGTTIAIKMQSTGDQDLADIVPANEPPSAASPPTLGMPKPTIVGAHEGGGVSINTAAANDYWNKTPGDKVSSGTGTSSNIPDYSGALRRTGDSSSSASDATSNYMPSTGGVSPVSATSEAPATDDAPADPFKGLSFPSAPAGSTTPSTTPGTTESSPSSSSAPAESPSLGGLQRTPEDVQLTPSPNATTTPSYAPYSAHDDSRLRDLYGSKAGEPAATPPASMPALSIPPAASTNHAWGSNATTSPSTSATTATTPGTTPALSLPTTTATPDTSYTPGATSTPDYTPAYTPGATSVPRYEPPAATTVAPRTLPSTSNTYEPVYTTSATSPSSYSGESYTVMPNDNYYSIADKVYGNGAYFKALEEHNRDRFPNPQRLNVGDTISTPPLEVLQQKYASLCPKDRGPVPDPSTIRSAGDRVANNGRVYTVQEGDTLFDIARYQLGRASRWAEIYEMNRTALGADFHYLVPGTQLILPDNSTSPRPLTTQNRTPFGR